MGQSTELLDCTVRVALCKFMSQVGHVSITSVKMQNSPITQGFLVLPSGHTDSPAQVTLLKVHSEP